MARQEPSGKVHHGHGCPFEEIGPDDWKARCEKAEARIKRLESAANLSDQRLLDAASKAGITPMGCDTADHLADCVVELKRQREKAWAACAELVLELGKVEPWCLSTETTERIAGLARWGEPVLDELKRLRDALRGCIDFSHRMAMEFSETPGAPRLEAWARTIERCCAEALAAW